MIIMLLMIRSKLLVVPHCSAETGDNVKIMMITMIMIVTMTLLNGSDEE